MVIHLIINSTIEINGQVGNIRVGTPVTVIVTSATGVVTIEQITPSSDGSFFIKYQHCKSFDEI